MIGKYCIIRGVNSGVHAGTVAEHIGTEVLLHDSRRLWYWVANGGVALSGLSQLGLKEGKIDVNVPNLRVLDACEIIECSDLAAMSISNYGA